MNFRKHAAKIVTAGLALTVAVPTIAMAAHPFDDVPDGQWYTDSVHWAYDNGLTTGKTPTTFAGNDPTNRYEVVAFFNRYHDNMVAPELADIRADARDDIEMQFDMFDSDASSTGATLVDDEALMDVTNTVTIPAGYTGVIEVEFTAEGACFGAGLIGWCEVDLMVDGEEISFVGQAFDSTDGGTEGIASWESHTVRAVSAELDPGTYSITASGYSSSPTINFAVADKTLTSEVHLTDRADVGFELGE